MPRFAPATVERQVRRVQRRLFLQILMRRVLTALAAGLLLATFWFLLRPFLFTSLGETARWAVPAGLVGLAVVVGAVLAYLHAPSRVMAALALDERFTLKERVTTLLTLSPQQRESPAGLALQDDVNTRVAELRIASRFPLTIPWQKSLTPAGALALALAACLFDPYLANLRFGPGGGGDVRAADTQQIQEQLDNLRKTALNRKPDEPKTEELQKLDEALDKLLEKPLDLNNADKVREHTNEMRDLQQKLKDELEKKKEQAEKNDQLKKELLGLGDRKMKEGPARDFQDALAKGNFKKAAEVLEKLQKDLKDKKLTPAEQKELAEQFRKTQEKLQRLLDDNDQLKQMKDLQEQAKKDNDEELQRELQRQMDHFKELADLAEMIGDCSSDFGKSDGEEIGDALGKMLKKLRQVELSEEEFKAMLKRAKDLDDQMKLLMARCQGAGNCQGNGLGQGKRPGGKRPIDPNDPDGKVVNERQRAESVPTGKQRVTGFVRGGSFTKIPSRAVEGAFRRAEQEAPDAIDRQRIPDDAADLARGYFRKLGNQKDD